MYKKGLNKSKSIFKEKVDLQYSFDEDLQISDIICFLNKKYMISYKNYLSDFYWEFLTEFSSILKNEIDDNDE